MLLYFIRPGSLRVVPCGSLPSRYSIRLVSVVRPLASVKPPTSTPSISMMKLNCPNGSIRLPSAIACSLSRLRARPPSGLRHVGAGAPLADAEDDELGRLHRGDADLADEAAVVDVGLRHRRVVALDVERLLLRAPLQHVVDPEPGQEVADAPPHARPQRFVVDLEDDPPRRAHDRLLDEDEQAAHVDVAPRRIGGDR